MRLSFDTFELKQREKYLPWKSITEPPFLICWSGAWITSTTTKDNLKIISDSITSWEAKRGRDKRSLCILRENMNKADLWAGHNVKGFDTKKVNTRFIFSHIHAPDFTIKQIDTLSIVKKYFKNDSNSLGYWLRRLGEIEKDEMRSEDWDACKAGDAKALRKMQKYNKRDVMGGAILLLELRDFLAGGGVDIFKV